MSSIKEKAIDLFVKKRTRFYRPENQDKVIVDAIATYEQCMFDAANCHILQSEYLAAQEEYAKVHRNMLKAQHDLLLLRESVQTACSVLGLCAECLETLDVKAALDPDAIGKDRACLQHFKQ